jgi:hypothetical protein
MGGCIVVTQDSEDWATASLYVLPFTVPSMAKEYEGISLARGLSVCAPPPSPLGNSLRRSLGSCSNTSSCSSVILPSNKVVTSGPLLSGRSSVLSFKPSHFVIDRQRSSDLVQLRGGASPSSSIDVISTPNHESPPPQLATPPWTRSDSPCVLAGI